MTPPRAKQLLIKSAPNRKLVVSGVRRYSDLMVGDAWKDYWPQPIILTQDDGVLDGQHRLHALMEAHLRKPEVTGYHMHMVRLKPGFDPGHMALYLDRGLSRKDKDVLTVGMDGTAVIGRHCAVARAMFFGMRENPGRLDDEVFLNFYRNHLDKIRMATDLFRSRTKGVARAQVVAVCARALYWIKTTDVERFARVLNTGVTESKSTIPTVRLRDWLKALETYTKSAALEAYKRSAYALSVVAENRHIDRCIAAKKELFPLPEEGAIIDHSAAAKILHAEERAVGVA